MRRRAAKPLAGTRVAITRPVGQGYGMRARVRALGGIVLSLPGSSLGAPENAKLARAQLQAALGCGIVIFTSPAAVRFARRLHPLRTSAALPAPGAATAAALRRAGLRGAIPPARADSEGLLALPILQRVRGRSIAVVGAPGGRGLLQRELAARGAAVIEAHVYRRMPARLDRRHAQALLRGRGTLFVPLSSTEALRNLLHGLPEDARCALLAGTAIASSARLLRAARAAGFARARRAASAHDDDLLAAIVAARANMKA